MAEILHQLIGSLSHYLQGFIHPRWLFGISAINSTSTQSVSIFQAAMLVYWSDRWAWDYITSKRRQGLYLAHLANGP